MRTFYILSGTNLGGATLSFLTLLENTISRGNSAVVVIPDDRPEFVERMESLKVSYYVLPLPFNSWPGSYGIKRFLGYPYVLLREQLQLRSLRKKLFKIVQKESPDIIHTNVSPLDAGHYAAKKFGIPHVWHIREYCDSDFNIHLFPTKRAYQRKLRNDYTICITKSLQIYNHLADSDKSFVIYNGVRRSCDTTFIPEKQKFFLMASRISEEKGHERTLRVFARFSNSHPDFKLVILGDGYEYFINRCKQLTLQLGIEDKVVFEGFTQDVDSYMRIATALLVASPSEGFGRMTAEAAFNGCIVLGYNAAGTKEILESTGGYLWNNDDEYYNAMENVASLISSEYSTKISVAQKVAQKLYSMESYVDNVFDIYGKALCGL